MPVTRTYRCDGPNCGHEFKHFHMGRDEPYPKCPQCGDDPHWVPGGFNMTSVKSKAVDMAQRMAEEDYGLTDMRDNTRAGDIVAKGPSPIQSSERDQIMQALTEHATQTQEIQQQQLAVAKMNKVEWGWQSTPGVAIPGGGGVGGPADIARQMGADPIGLLHEAGKAGKAGISADIVAAADSSGQEVEPQATSVPI